MSDNELCLLIEGLEVFLEEADNKVLDEKFERTSMKEYLDMIEKSWKDLDPVIVRENISSVWVVRKGTGELPVPFPREYFLNVNNVG